MKIELNITMRCNLGCPNCNRMCNIYRDRIEDMSIDQIKRFIEQAKLLPEQKRKVKIVGGEPLLHPNIAEINDIFAEAVEKKWLSSVKYGTNKIITNSNKLPPEFKKSPFVRFSGMISRKKKHLPYLQSPVDMGWKKGDEPLPKRMCSQIRRCGFSLDKYGYLPCSLAIMIVRLFGWTDLYRYEIPRVPWELERICKHCILSMGKGWCNQHAKYFKNMTPEDSIPSKTFKEAMDKFNLELFHQTQKEF